MTGEYNFGSSHSSGSEQFDLVIVGGGMVGLALAVDIASRDDCAQLKIALVEATDLNPPTAVEDNLFDPRVVALSDQSRQLLVALGVWSDIAQQRACPYVAMHVWDAEGTGSIDFHCDDLHADSLGTIVENSVIVAALRRRVASFANIILMTGARVTDITLMDEQPNISDHEGQSWNLLSLDLSGTAMSIKGKLIVAADGARSQLRDLAALPVREWDYGHTAIVTTVKTQQPHQLSCWQRFTQDGPIALLPLANTHAHGSLDGSNGHYCSLVWSAATPLSEVLMAQDDAEFCAALGSAFEHRLGRIVEVAARHAIPLRQRHAVDYVCPGLALVGDAAHTIHPLAGQGVNLGFYDVAALADEIGRACKRHLPLSDYSILRRYQRARKSHNLSAMLIMEGFKRLFGADDPAIRWLRNSGMSFMNKQTFLKKQLSKIASGQAAL